MLIKYIALGIVLALLAAGCGHKGPPKPPDSVLAGR
jgi:predicted small lipoprotein YifL